VWTRASTTTLSVLSVVLVVLFPLATSGQESVKEGTLSAQQLWQNLKAETYSGEPVDLV
jgi:hypothetical protein